MTEKAPVSNSKCDLKCLFLITRQETGCAGIPRSSSHIANPILSIQIQSPLPGWLLLGKQSVPWIEYLDLFISFSSTKIKWADPKWVLQWAESGGNEQLTCLLYWKRVQSFTYVLWSWWCRGCMGYSRGKQQNAWSYNRASTCFWTSHNTVRVLIREGNTTEGPLMLDVRTRAFGRVSCISCTSSMNLNHSFLETM